MHDSIHSSLHIYIYVQIDFIDPFEFHESLYVSPLSLDAAALPAHVPLLGAQDLALAWPSEYRWDSFRSHHSFLTTLTIISYHIHIIYIHIILYILIHIILHNSQRKLLHMWFILDSCLARGCSAGRSRAWPCRSWGRSTPPCRNCQTNCFKS